MKVQRLVRGYKLGIFRGQQITKRNEIEVNGRAQKKIQNAAHS